jgi:hypothetical protein
MVGSEVVEVVKHLADFVSLASNAKTDADFDRAGEHFAIAVSKVGVDVAVAVLTHKAGKAAKPYLKPPPSSGAVLDMVTPDGQVIRVPIDSLPETPQSVAGQAGLESRGSGGTGGGGANRPLGTTADYVHVVGSDYPGGKLPFENPDPTLSRSRFFVDQSGRPLRQDYIVQLDPAERGSVQGSVSRPYNELEPRIVHGAHGQARQFGGPDAPYNIVPTPADINTEAMGAVERDLLEMKIMGQDVYVQVYYEYAAPSQRIPLTITYRIFRKFEGAWGQLKQAHISVMH